MGAPSCSSNRQRRKSKGEMETLKIGLVGAYFANFDAMRLGVYQNACGELSKLGDELGFELLAYPDGVQTQDEAATAAAWIAAANVDFLLVQCSSFSLGNLIVPLADLDVRLGLWFLPEPALEGQIPLNSFTGFNLFVSIIRTHLGQASRPLKWFYGNTGDAMFRRRLAVSVAALKALKALAGATIGLVGAPAPSFLNLAHDGSALMQRLGVRVEQVPLDELFARVPGYGAAQVEKALAILTRPARRVETGHTWLEASGRVYLSARDLALDVGCAALGSALLAGVPTTYGWLGSLRRGELAQRGWAAHLLRRRCACCNQHARRCGHERRACNPGRPGCGGRRERRCAHVALRPGPSLLGGRRGAGPHLPPNTRPRQPSGRPAQRPFIGSGVRAGCGHGGALL